MDHSLSNGNQCHYKHINQIHILIELCNRSRQQIKANNDREKVWDRQTHTHTFYLTSLVAVKGQCFGDRGSGDTKLGG